MGPVVNKPQDYNETFPHTTALGCLLHLRLTWPDCLVAMNMLDRFMKNPKKTHWLTAKTIFRHLKGTKNRGLLHQSSIASGVSKWALTMWVDSDYGTDVDTRRSRAGFLIYLNKNLIAFNSTLQRGHNLEQKYPGLVLPETEMDGEPMPTMATATCGAEYMALSLAVKELIWIYMLLKTMGLDVDNPCIVYEDNRSTIKIAENATALRRTKHIDIRHHFLREHVDNGLIKLVAVGTADQRADILTKILGRELYERFRNIITSDIELNKD